MSLNTLNNDCLRQIFSFLSPIDLLTIDLVTPRWTQLREEICNSRTSLTIVIGTPTRQVRHWVKHHLENHPEYSTDRPIVVSGFQCLSMMHLFRTFKNIRSLVIVAESLSMKNLSWILELTKDKLEFLIIGTDKPGEWTAHPFVKMKSLKHLLMYHLVYFRELLDCFTQQIESFVFYKAEIFNHNEVPQLIDKLAPNVCSLTFPWPSTSPRMFAYDRIQQIKHAIIPFFSENSSQRNGVIMHQFSQICSQTPESLTIEESNGSKFVIDAQFIEVPVHKFSLKSAIFKSDSWIFPNVHITTLKLLESDFVASTVKKYLMNLPNLHTLELNCSSVCCECEEVEPVPPPPPQPPSSADAPNNPPSVNANQPGQEAPPERPLQNDAPPNPEVPPPPPVPQLNDNPDEPEEIVIVTCDACCQALVDAIAQVEHLTKFVCVGTDCNPVIVRGMTQFKNIGTIDFTLVDSWSNILKVFLEAGLDIARANPEREIRLLLPAEIRSRILRFPRDVPNIRLNFDEF